MWLTRPVTERLSAEISLSRTESNVEFYDDRGFGVAFDLTV